MSANTDFKTSLLVGRQLPEFVRDEYPTFVTFLEAYYEFLEKKQGTQKNDLVNAAKNLRDIRDVDSSIAEFETNFYNTYASLIPIEVQSDKALLFKHLVPLYKSKGSDASFKLLFRLVFGEDIDLILPKNNVLKASGSKWQIDNKLRINAQISSRYVGNGSTKIFNLAQVSTADQITVYVDGIEKNLTTDFFLKVEYRQLIFKTAPANNSVVTVEYSEFNPALLYNRKVTGLTSGASAIIESTNRRIISDSLNLGFWRAFDVAEYIFHGSLFGCVFPLCYRLIRTKLRSDHVLPPRYKEMLLQCMPAAHFDFEIPSSLDWYVHASLCITVLKSCAQVLRPRG